MSENPGKGGSQRWITNVRALIWHSATRFFAPEYFRDLHLGLFGSEPKAETASGYLDKAKQSTGPDPILPALIQSEEFRTRMYQLLAPDLVQACYRGILERDGDPGGLQAYTRKLGEAGQLDGMIAGLLKSDEFQRKRMALRAPETVKAAYRAILGREADEAGLDIYTSIVKSEGGLEAMLKSLSESEECRGRDTQSQAMAQGLDQPLTPALVQTAFLLTLGKPALEGELASHLLLKTAGKLRETLLRSAEFLARWSKLSEIAEPAPADLTAPKTVFVHIPKTGGLTLHEALAPSFPSSQICPERYGGLHLSRSGELAKYRFFSGHYRLEQCALIPGPKRVITILRRPVDRLVSVYNFMRAHTAEMVERFAWRDAELARKHSMIEFFSLNEIVSNPLYDNTMVRILTPSPLIAEWKRSKDESESAAKVLGNAKESLRSILAFGIMERYQESAELIFHSLGLPMPAQIKPRNVLKDLVGKSSRIEKDVKTESCGPEAMRAMAPLVELDQALYDFALGLFEEKIAPLKASRPSPAPEERSPLAATLPTAPMPPSQSLETVS